MRFLVRYREWILMPLFGLVMWGMIHLVHRLTGRPPTDDPGELVGACYRAIRLAMVIALVGYVQDHHFGYRSERGGTFGRLRDDLYDAGVTFALLALFAWLLWH